MERASKEKERVGKKQHQQTPANTLHLLGQRDSSGRKSAKTPHSDGRPAALRSVPGCCSHSAQQAKKTTTTSSKPIDRYAVQGSANEKCRGWFQRPHLITSTILTARLCCLSHLQVKPALPINFGDEMSKYGNVVSSCE